MQRGPSCIAVLLALVAVVSVPGQTRADTVYATYSNISPGLNVNINLSGVYSGGARTGVNNWHGSASSDVFANANFQAFCIEIRQTLNSPITFTVTDLENAPQPGGYPESSDPYDSGAGMGGVRAEYIRKLWGGYFTDALTSNVNAAAFQLAVWELVYETTTVSDMSLNLDVWSGHFKATNQSSAVNLANTWLGYVKSGVDPVKGNLPSASLKALTSDDAQDMVVFLPSESTVPIPTPASAALGLVSFSVLGFGRRRQTRV